MEFEVVLKENRPSHPTAVANNAGDTDGLIYKNMVIFLLPFSEIGVCVCVCIAGWISGMELDEDNISADNHRSQSKEIW